MSKLNTHEQFLSQGLKSGVFPKKVYKFRSIDRALDILKNLEFYFASPKTFNDPFDCALNEVLNYTPEDISRWYQTNKDSINMSEQDFINFTQNNKLKFNKLVKQTKEKTLYNKGILSLSKTKENILLWSHYAENHAGVSIELEIGQDLHFFSIPININYKKTYNPQNYLLDSEQTMKEIISTKSEDWKYEEEIRIYKSVAGVVSIKPKAITGIYFGINTSDENIKKIQDACTKNNLSHVKFYKAIKKYGEFKLDFKTI